MKKLLSPQWRWLLLLALAALIFLPRLGSREFWSPDEPRFALIAQETMEGGNPLVPQLYGEVYSNKPPLYLWLVGIFSLLWGRVTEWSARLPSALAAIGAVPVTYLLGRRLLGERAAWIGAGVLLTSPHFYMRSRWASTDMTLSFFFLLSIYFLVRSLNPGTGHGVRTGAGRWFFVACALATLTKGPVGLVLPVGILVLTLVAERRFSDLLRFPWLTGFAVFFLIVTPWYVLYGLQVGGDKFFILTISENIGRYLNAWNDVKPFYWYLIRFPLSFLPWSLFLPGMVVALIRCRREKEAGPLWFLLFWFLLVFLFFSISSGKRTVYLLPIFPAAALLAGWFLDRGFTYLGSRRFAWTFGTSLALGILLLGGGAALAVQAPAMHPPAGLAGMVAGLFLMGAAVPVVYLGWRNRLPSLAASLAAGMLFTEAVFSLWMLPRLNGYQNVRGFSARIAATVPPAGKFATTRKKRDAFSFYTGLRGEEIKDDADLARLLNSPEPVYCLLKESEWKKSSRAGNLPGTVILREPVSRYTYVLVANEVNHARPAD